ncbi:MAG TPA: hydrogenase expression/formation protein HypE [Candidatus Goldiibacteriota bacterium]|nr:hydrogenase expression/formation protein HypE [Candidatus Goldiibacteriota bacterium]
MTGLIMKYLGNPTLNKMEDSACLPGINGRMAFTTDSFVVSPAFFSGGDIGKLAVCGTVNDLAAAGAKPLFLTAGLILEEGFSIRSLEKILISMKKTAFEAGVTIVAGDTKVVERGKADKIFINTSGLGSINQSCGELSVSNAAPGDAVIISGTLGDHETAILKERKGLSFKSLVKSDCAPLYGMIKPLLRLGKSLHSMRDATRGGLAAVLNEIAASSGVDLMIYGSRIPVNKAVKAACGLFGFDPLFMANEGKMAVICDSGVKNRVLKILRKHKYGRKAAIIGEVLRRNKSPKVYEKTDSGGERIVLMPEGEMLPRIC